MGADLGLGTPGLQIFPLSTLAGAARTALQCREGAVSAPSFPSEVSQTSVSGLQPEQLRRVT